MALTETPLNLDRIVAAAEDVIRRYGPSRATVVDAARALGVSHAAVYRHVATKAELRRLVVGRWVEATMAPLRAIAAAHGPAPQRLRQLIEALVAVKRRRCSEDPELFAAYRILAAEVQTTVTSHVESLIALAAAIIRDGIEEGTLRPVDPLEAARGVLYSTSWFHHPAHASEWGAATDSAFDAVWSLVMDGLCRRAGAE